VTRPRTAGAVFVRVQRSIPLAHPGSRSGMRAIMSIVFYAVVGLALARLGAWSHATGTDRAAAILLSLALYAGAIGGGTLLPSAMQPARRRFKSDRTARSALAVLVVMAAVAVAAPLVTRDDPARIVAPSKTRFEAPGVAHPMGTDRFGRDVWARVAYGGRASFGVCGIAVLLAVAFGTMVGAISGMASARVDDAIMRVVDGMLAFPRVLLLLTAVAFLPPGAIVLALLIAATSWMGIARVVRGEFQRLRGHEFVDAAIASGASRGRLIARHLLPNALGPVVVAGTLSAGTIILLESSLSFLGLGIQPPAPSWGAMVFDGRDSLATAWWVSGFPALAITLAVVALNVIGDGLRDALDTRRPSG
jgi:peptide/nickel transport system permease protein